jgi:hypothetical protein
MVVTTLVGSLNERHDFEGFLRINGALPVAEKSDNLFEKFPVNVFGGKGEGIGPFHPKSGATVWGNTLSNSPDCRGSAVFPAPCRHVGARGSEVDHLDAAFTHDCVEDLYGVDPIVIKAGVALGFSFGWLVERAWSMRERAYSSTGRCVGSANLNEFGNESETG